MRIIEDDDGPVAFQREVMGSRINEVCLYNALRFGSPAPTALWVLIQPIGSQETSFRVARDTGANCFLFG